MSGIYTDAQSTMQQLQESFMRYLRSPKTSSEETEEAVQLLRQLGTPNIQLQTELLSTWKSQLESELMELKSQVNSNQVYADILEFVNNGGYNFLTNMSLQISLFVQLFDQPENKSDLVEMVTTLMAHFKDILMQRFQAEINPRDCALSAHSTRYQEKLLFSPDYCLETIESLISQITSSDTSLPKIPSKSTRLFFQNFWSRRPPKHNRRLHPGPGTPSRQPRSTILCCNSENDGVTTSFFLVFASFVRNLQNKQLNYLMDLCQEQFKLTERKTKYLSDFDQLNMTLKSATEKVLRRYAEAKCKALTQLVSQNIDSFEWQTVQKVDKQLSLFTEDASPKKEMTPDSLKELLQQGAASNTYETASLNSSIMEKLWGEEPEEQNTSSEDPNTIEAALANLTLDLKKDCILTAIVRLTLRAMIDMVQKQKFSLCGMQQLQVTAAT
uniref:Vacuolar protein sorting-associated protein 51 homolog n=1 Tax=Ditylenchus dipsaci TaxID=166011 RepID=A0A915D0R8_9BILA